MMIRLDAPFIKALNDAGYQVDWKTMKKIYMESRQDPVVKRRRRENAELQKQLAEEILGVHVCKKEGS